MNIGQSLGLENFDQCFTTQDPDSIDSDDYYKNMTNFTWDIDNSQPNR